MQEFLRKPLVFGAGGSEHGRGGHPPHHDDLTNMSLVKSVTRRTQGHNLQTAA
jgi:hypothetical protein